MNGTKVLSINHLYRRGFGPPDKRFLNPDGSATSRLFKLRAKDEGKLSVDVKEMTTPDQAVIDPTKFILFEIPVRGVSEIKLDAIHDPLTLEEHGVENLAHALILGIDDDDDVKPGLLARMSKRIDFPANQYS
ncbi:MAG: hypothetical protein ACO1NW_14225 [Chitinophagaceae bacterium]